MRDVVQSGVVFRPRCHGDKNNGGFGKLDRGHERHIVTFSLSYAIFELLSGLLIMGFPISSPQIGGFWPLKSLKWSSINKTLERHIPAWGRVFWITRRSDLGRRVDDLCADRRKTGKFFLKPQGLYISHQRRNDPRSGSNVKLYPLRYTPGAVNAANFQLDPHNSVGSTEVRVWGLFQRCGAVAEWS